MSNEKQRKSTHQFKHFSRSAVEKLKSCDARTPPVIKQAVNKNELIDNTSGPTCFTVINCEKEREHIQCSTLPLLAGIWIKARQNFQDYYT